MATQPGGDWRLEICERLQFGAAVKKRTRDVFPIGLVRVNYQRYRPLPSGTTSVLNCSTWKVRVEVSVLSRCAACPKLGPPPRNRAAPISNSGTTVPRQRA